MPPASKAQAAKTLDLERLAQQPLQHGQHRNVVKSIKKASAHRSYPPGNHSAEAKTAEAESPYCGALASDNAAASCPVKSRGSVMVDHPNTPTKTGNKPDVKTTLSDSQTERCGRNVRLTQQ